MSTVVLLNKDSSVSLGFLLPLAALVIAISLLDHPGSVVEFALLAVREGEAAEVGFALAAPLGKVTVHVVVVLVGRVLLVILLMIMALVVMTVMMVGVSAV